MSDNRKKLLKMFEQKHRYSNFGQIMNKLKINGFRGINDFEIDFNYPITAVSGLNGSGKSSICQLAVCGYKKPITSQNYKRYYVKDFFPVSVLDPLPFKEGSAVEFHYQTDTPGSNQALTISRKASEWSGYKRQPERHCYYIGFTVYIPKVERRDLSIYFGTKIKRDCVRKITDDAEKHVKSILNKNYSDIQFQKIVYNSNKSKQELELGVVKENDIEYSENHMGFGEARILYIIDLLENNPDNSLFIIEEPETSLHEDAQHKFIKYLIDVCIRKKHQIILSTHSSIILHGLPPEGRVCIIKENKRLHKIEGLSSNRARSILSNGHQKALTIIVEDKVAKNIIEQIIKTYKISILKDIGIFDVGNIDSIKKTINVTQSIYHLNILGILDTETNVKNADNLISMPGSKRPEEEVLEPQEVRDYLNSELSIDIDSVMNNPELDNHHSFFKQISEVANISEEYVSLIAINKYVEVKGRDYFTKLISKIEEKL